MINWPPLLHLFGLLRGVKWCKSRGGGDNFFIASKHHFYPLDSPKRCRNERLINLLLPHSFIVLLPWQPVTAQKDVRVLSRILFKKDLPFQPTLKSLCPLAAPLLYHFTRSEQVTPWLLHHFTTLAAQFLHHFTPLSANYTICQLRPLFRFSC